MRSVSVGHGADAPASGRRPRARQPAPALATAPVQSPATGSPQAFDGIVEAVRQSVVAAQVAGAIVALDVKAGDIVKAGQTLARIDARAAEQNVAASDAQVRSAQAHAGRGEQGLRAPEAAVRQAVHQPGGAGAGRIAVQGHAGAGCGTAGAGRRGAHAVRFLSSCARPMRRHGRSPVAQGDMAMPGRALLTLYEPGALRVTAAVPQSALSPPRKGRGSSSRACPKPSAGWTRHRAGAAHGRRGHAHRADSRIALPAGLTNVAPGTFARVWLPMQGAATPRLYVPAAAVVRRAEMTRRLRARCQGHGAAAPGAPGPSVGDSVEVLSGVAAGERVALDPQAAAREP